jgi:hypothetical protein
MTTRAKTGRRVKFEITDDVIEEIKKLAANHMNQSEMRVHFGIAESTWFRKIQGNKKVQAAIDEGFFATKKFVVSKFMEHVRAGNLKALMFWLKTQGKWAEHTKAVVNPVTGAAKIVIPKTFSDDPNIAVKQYLEIMG